MGKNVSLFSLCGLSKDFGREARPVAMEFRQILVNSAIPLS